MLEEDGKSTIIKSINLSTKIKKPRPCHTTPFRRFHQNQIKNFREPQKKAKKIITLLRTTLKMHQYLRDVECSKDQSETIMCIINGNILGKNIIHVFIRNQGQTFNGRILCTSDKIKLHDLILAINYWSEGEREEDGVYTPMSVYTLAADFLKDDLVLV